jgi:membrane-associated protease RseP (regulator of RpoE activity)
MSTPEWIEQGPSIDAFAGTFYVYEVQTDGDRIEYYGTPLVSHERLVEELWPAFRESGYDLRFERKGPEKVLVAEPNDVGIDGIPWTNVFLFLATVVSTLFVGAVWYYQIDPTSNPAAILRAWPFTAAVMGVFGVHEMGHYVMSRYHGVRASLPYFIPLPTLFGTMGAVIKLRGRMPDRKALFDIGVAGPLAGLVATFVVTVVGLQLDPVSTVEPSTQSGESLMMLNFPPLLDAIAALIGHADRAAYHPVVVGGWVGMFITFLNMLPVGQLDGGHVSRAMFGEYQETIAAAVPGGLLALGAYLHYAAGVDANSVSVWFFWGVITLLLALVGSVRPIDDAPIGPGRFVVGAMTFVLAALCFTPVPIELIG